MFWFVFVISLLLSERYFSSCHERGTKKKFLDPMRNRTSDLRIPRSDALPLSHGNSTVSEVYYEVHMTRVLRTARISNVDSVMFVNRLRKMVSFELGKEIVKDIFRVWDKEKIQSPHEESNLRPSDSALRCSTTEPRRLYGERGIPRSEGIFHFFFTELKTYHHSEGLRFDSSWGLSSSHARDETKNIFHYFSTELKTYLLSHSSYCSP